MLSLSCYIIDCTIIDYYIMCLWYSALIVLWNFYMYVFGTNILYEIMSKFCQKLAF